MNVIKERISEIISNSLTEDCEVFEVNNVQYLKGAPPSETEFTATIKSKSDSDFTGYISITFYKGFESSAEVEFSENILINFQKVIVEGDDIINKLKQGSYDLCFMYYYCFGKKGNIPDFNNVNNLIDCYKSVIYHYRFLIDINDFNIGVASELHLQEDKVMLDIEVETMTEEFYFSFKIANDIKEYEKMKRFFLKEAAAIPLNKELEELKMEDYKLLHIINY